jgi:hypothetical protein
VPIRVQAVALARLVHGQGVTGDRDHRNDRAALHELGVHPVLGQIPGTTSERVPRILTLVSQKTSNLRTLQPELTQPVTGRPPIRYRCRAV